MLERLLLAVWEALADWGVLVRSGQDGDVVFAIDVRKTSCWRLGKPKIGYGTGLGFWSANWERLGCILGLPGHLLGECTFTALLFRLYCVGM